MKAKLLAVLLTVAMLLGLCAPAMAASGFSDVPEDSWYTESVQYMADNGLMSGTGADSFSPNEATSRAMLVTVLWRQAGQPAATQTATFDDTEADTWYSAALDWAVENGVINGYGNGNFGPADPVSREQLATILWRMAGEPEVAEREDFADQDAISAYAVTAWPGPRPPASSPARAATILTPRVPPPVPRLP